LHYVSFKIIAELIVSSVQKVVQLCVMCLVYCSTTYQKMFTSVDFSFFVLPVAGDWYSAIVMMLVFDILS